MCIHHENKQSFLAGTPNDEQWIKFSHRRAAEDAEKPIFCLAVRDRQIKRLLLLQDKALNSLHSFQRVPVLWSKGSSFWSNRRLPIGSEERSFSATSATGEIILSFVSKTFLFHCRCTRSIAGGIIPWLWRSPLLSSNPDENPRNRTESRTPARCALRFLWFEHDFDGNYGEEWL